ncbi:beta-ketoacyl-[acyl-carrier-protein] synthase family protein [Mucilaginibacter boryungensis]|uniref:3-oxoacyl-ACP synthase n=1 Tax=Mucilaginibacter boryungensis TaxID=768480 RepID=A0ABR9XLF2_9SPHI|nr:hypothetical protein [Mucilaginibacter boryungensis]MBE9668047.1 hypothetical protein [Mucilaginibacter boryungensis]
MAAQKYITATCSISNNQVHLNGEQVFAGNSKTVDELLLSIYQHFHFSYPKFHKMDNLSKLGWLTAELLLKDFNEQNYHAEQVGTVLANANASLDMDLRYYDSLKDVPSPSLFVYTLPNIVAGEICIRHNFKGENAFFVQPSFDADFIHRQVSYLLDKNILQACICGWIDVLGQEYTAKLFLVEKIKKENAAEFSVEKIKSPL